MSTGRNHNNLHLFHHIIVRFFSSQVGNTIKIDTFRWVLTLISDINRPFAFPRLLSSSAHDSCCLPFRLLINFIFNDVIAFRNTSCSWNTYQMYLGGCLPAFSSGEVMTLTSTSGLSSSSGTVPVCSCTFSATSSVS